MAEFEVVALIGGLKLGWVGLRLRNAMSQKWCEMELGWQLTTNGKSYMGFWLQQKFFTLNDLEHQFIALSSDLCILWWNG